MCSLIPEVGYTWIIGGSSTDLNLGCFPEQINQESEVSQKFQELKFTIDQKSIIQLEVLNKVVLIYTANYSPQGGKNRVIPFGCMAFAFNIMLLHECKSVNVFLISY